jgi:hypothetical protein
MLAIAIGVAALVAVVGNKNASIGGETASKH